MIKITLQTIAVSIIALLAGVFGVSATLQYVVEKYGILNPYEVMPRNFEQEFLIKQAIGYSQLASSGDFEAIQHQSCQILEMLKEHLDPEFYVDSPAKRLAVQELYEEATKTESELRDQGLC